MNCLDVLFFFLFKIKEALLHSEQDTLGDPNTSLLVGTALFTSQSISTDSLQACTNNCFFLLSLTIQYSNVNISFLPGLYMNVDDQFNKLAQLGTVLLHLAGVYCEPGHTAATSYLG